MMMQMKIASSFILSLLYSYYLALLYVSAKIIFLGLDVDGPVQGSDPL